MASNKSGQPHYLFVVTDGNFRREPKTLYVEPPADAVPEKLMKSIDGQVLSHDYRGNMQTAAGLRLGDCFSVPAVCNLEVMRDKRGRYFQPPQIRRLGQVITPGIRIETGKESYEREYMQANARIDQAVIYTFRYGGLHFNIPVFLTRTNYAMAKQLKHGLENIVLRVEDKDENRRVVVAEPLRKLLTDTEKKDLIIKGDEYFVGYLPLIRTGETVEVYGGWFSNRNKSLSQDVIHEHYPLLKEIDVLLLLDNKDTRYSNAAFLKHGSIITKLGTDLNMTQTKIVFEEFMHIIREHRNRKKQPRYPAVILQNGTVSWQAAASLAEKYNIRTVPLQNKSR